MTECRMYAKTIQGIFHKEREIPNQDCIKTFRHNNIAGCAMSDGCSSAEYAVPASAINCNVAEILSRDSVIWEYSEREFKQRVLNEYRKQFELSGYPYEELSATTAFVIINTETNEYIAFSVGDTGVLTYDEEMNFSVFLEPKNGIRKTITYFTNDDTAVKVYSCYRRGKIFDISGFVLYTDGAEYIEKHSSMLKSLINSINTSDEGYDEEENRLFEKLKEQSKDDISISVLSLLSDDIYEEEKTQQKEDNIKTSFLKYLEKPRSAEEIVKSGLIGENEVISALILLEKIGVVTCIGKKYKINL